MKNGKVGTNTDLQKMDRKTEKIVLAVSMRFTYTRHRVSVWSHCSRKFCDFMPLSQISVGTSRIKLSGLFRLKDLIFS